MNLADLVLALAFVVVLGAGLRQGLIGFFLTALATLLSVVIAGAVAIWIGAESSIPVGARLLVIPAAFFATLWIAGFLLGRMARAVRGGTHRSPAGAIDRLLGAALAAGVGVLILSLVIFAVLLVPFDNRATGEVESAVFAPWILEAGSLVMDALARPLPFLRPLAARLGEAGRKLQLEAPVETRARVWRAAVRGA